MIITRVSEDRWKQAQAWEKEIQKKIAAKGDDFNYWWFEKFDGYKVIRNRIFYNVLEVGCGSVTNARLILPLIQYRKLWLEDPLIYFYEEINALESELTSALCSEPLEKLSLADYSMDLVICINVLDHVQDALRCMLQMRRVLKAGGVLILGQDLSNQEDFERCPSSWQDVGHPIKLDDAFFAEHLEGFTPLYNLTLTREAGRNPQAHYGTLCYIGRKL